MFISVPFVHDPAAPPEEVSITFYFLWLFANRVCSSTEESGGWAELISM